MIQLKNRGKTLTETQIDDTQCLLNQTRTLTRASVIVTLGEKDESKVNQKIPRTECEPESQDNPQENPLVPTF